MLDLGSVSAAAEVLGYTQSAVSQQLAALERELGATLVDRSQRPLTATPAGTRLRPHVEAVLASVAGAEAALEDLHAGTPRLRLAAFPSALASFLPVAVRELRRRDPNLLVQVLQHETREAIEVLRKGDADVAVVHHLPGVAVPEMAGLRRLPLLVDRLWIVLPEGHRLARREAIALADLDGEPLILPRRGTPAGRFRSLIEHLCAQAGFEPRVAFELNDLPSAQAFVAAGMAIVPMHGLTLATVPAGVAIRPLTDRDAGSRAVEALAASGAREELVGGVLAGLDAAARQYLHRQGGRAADVR